MAKLTRHQLTVVARTFRKVTDNGDLLNKLINVQKELMEAQIMHEVYSVMDSVEREGDETAVAVVRHR